MMTVLRALGPWLVAAALILLVVLAIGVGNQFANGFDQLVHLP